MYCKLAEEKKLVAVQIISNIFQWRCWCWKKLFSNNNQRVLRYPSQNLDQPSVLVTAFTGKASTGINGITLHSAFHLLVKAGLKYDEYKKSNDETFHNMRNKYQYLKVLIIEEISTIGGNILDHLDLTLKPIMQNSSLLGSVFC